MVHFVCKITFIGCFWLLGFAEKASKKQARSMSHMAYTSPHTINSSGRSGENKITYVHMYYIEFHAKSTCLTSHFHSITW